MAVFMESLVRGLIIAVLIMTVYKKSHNRPL